MRASGGTACFADVTGRLCGLPHLLCLGIRLISGASTRSATLRLYSAVAATVHCLKDIGRGALHSAQKRLIINATSERAMSVAVNILVVGIIAYAVSRRGEHSTAAEENKKRGRKNVAGQQIEGVGKDIFVKHESRDVALSPSVGGILRSK